MSDTVTVIGAGNGGMAISAYLASIGVDVNIFDLFPEYLAGFKNTKTIYLIKDGKKIKSVLHKVTENIAEALEGSKLVMVVAPAFAHKMIAEACAPYLQDGQIIICNPGRTGGAIEFLSTVRACGCSRKILVGESSTLVYSCRKQAPDTVEVFGTKEELLLGVLPSTKTKEVTAVLNKYYPQFKPVDSCLVTSLSNIGALFHPTPMLLNIGRVESDPKGYHWYTEGISPSVAKLVKAIDKERLAIADAFHLRILSAEEWLKDSYETHGDTLYELIQNNGAYKDIMAPKTIQARYVTEDVPMSLVPMSELGRAIGVPTPCMDAVIQLTSTIYGKDFRKEGRNLEKMGLAGMDVKAIEDVFTNGK